MTKEEASKRADELLVRVGLSDKADVYPAMLSGGQKQDVYKRQEGYSKDLETKMHQTIKKVSNDFENLKYNTAIAAMMTLLNDF